MLASMVGNNKSSKMWARVLNVLTIKRRLIRDSSILQTGNVIESSQKQPTSSRGGSPLASNPAMRTLLKEVIKMKPTKAKCRKCGETLHNLINYGDNTLSSTKQCLNRECSRYGMTVYS